MVTAERGITLLDLVVVLAVVGLLVYLARLDQRRVSEPVAPVPAAARVAG